MVRCLHAPMVCAVTSLSADQLCASINRRVPALSFEYVDGEVEQTLSVEGREPIRFPVDAGGTVQGGSASWVSTKHENGAIHEPGLVATLLALYEGGLAPRTMLDIGSLYGYVSFLTRSLWADVEVHAFEANPRSYEALLRNIEANGAAFGDTIQAHHCALSDVSEEKVKVHVHRMLIDRSGRSYGPKAKGFDHQLDMWSLDDFCEARSIVPDLIKIDVEGYQAKIIPGATGVIAEHRPVILLEFDAPGASNDFGVTNRDVIRPLMADGYRLVWGDHRSTRGGFEVLGWDDLTNDHEVNSLGILLP